ncbi:hypothetical protein EI42_02538 [Thermosporothrix hazakensis]|jgi:hypothetical protein|uniref:Uncharacterized protein n=2 Tax=Thermosporothrix TaxID=768650 RepID=A0A326U8Q2_THEHA|nr:hypothetical protein EI42_02538 [Thermosporothrix hazakensis]BBH91281.1 hypothetical protein KTC_60320 [Thermosporothrix sp. COM3]GCE49428.1 hypothetical protein KTH_42970 [Thermosporothrix hazakensis]
MLFPVDGGAKGTAFFTREHTTSEKGFYLTALSGYLTSAIAPSEEAFAAIFPTTGNL